MPITSSTPQISLHDVLHNRAPTPYTLPSLMCYTNANHCSETLSFYLAARQYQLAYTRTLERSSGSFTPRDTAHLTGVWAKLLEVYLAPCAPKEINIPGRIKDAVARVPYEEALPEPEALDEILKVVYDLMSDSVLPDWMASIAEDTTATGTAVSCPVPDYVLRGRLPNKVAATTAASSSSPSASALPQQQRQQQQQLSNNGQLPLQLFTTDPSGGLSPISPGSGGGWNKGRESSSSAASGDIDGELTPPATPPVGGWRKRLGLK